jgi:hypothetical protein
VSIDERRAFFRQNLFHSKQGQDLVELWFPGVHCDVGGGYSNGRLWWSPFVWMVDEAEKRGLLINEARREEILANPPSQPWAEPINNSLTWKWYIGEVWPKFRYTQILPRPNLGMPRQIRSGARIHHSALERIRDAQTAYEPPGFPSGFCASTRSLATIPSELPVP